MFYPAVREALSDEDLVDEGLEEHHAAELLMWELERLPADAPRYDAKVTVLKENVLHHVEEEETELFPKVRDGHRRGPPPRARCRDGPRLERRPEPAAPALARHPARATGCSGCPAAGFDLGRRGRARASSAGVLRR